MERAQKYLQALFLLLLVFALAACTVENDGGEMAGGSTTPPVEEAASDEEASAGQAGGSLEQAPLKQRATGRLEQAISRYRQLEEQGGFPEVPTGPVLKPGASSERVPALREYLSVTGDLQGVADSAQGNVYTEQLAEAVRRFQKRHGIRPDGVVGPNTVEQMNVPISERLRHMEASLRRMESLPDSNAQRYLLVNIPEFALHVYDGGRRVDHMRVVVGEEYDDQQTPRFSDRMEYLIFRPYWNVPDGIAEEELVPEGISYLKENNLEIVESWTPEAEPMEMTQANLERVKTGELKLRQKPGPENSLGLVKFMFPNQDAIYLHGTPEDQLFREDTRAFSHGCIRVQRPVDLALYALKGKPEWTRERIEQAMNSGEASQRVTLDQTIPVHITYLTAYVDPKGQVQFRDDIYDLLDGGGSEPGAETASAGESGGAQEEGTR